MGPKNVIRAKETLENLEKKSLGKLRYRIKDYLIILSNIVMKAHTHTNRLKTAKWLPECNSQS